MQHYNTSHRRHYQQTCLWVHERLCLRKSDMVAKFVGAVLGYNVLLRIEHIQGCLMYSPEIAITIFYERKYITPGLLFYCPKA